MVLLPMASISKEVTINWWFKITNICVLTLLGNRNPDIKCIELCPYVCFSLRRIVYCFFLTAAFIFVLPVSWQAVTLLQSFVSVVILCSSYLSVSKFLLFKGYQSYWITKINVILLYIICTEIIFKQSHCHRYVS